MKIVFFGTPEFAVEALKKVHKHHEVALVVTKPDAKKKRGHKMSPSAVKKFAVEEGLAVVTPSVLDDDFISMAQAVEADVFVVVAYGKIMSEKLIHSAKYGALNIHASLLPKYRGASPLQSALLNGDTTSGVTIMQIVKELDAGDILLKKELDITNHNLSTLHDELAVIGADAIVEVLDNIEFFLNNKKAQDHSKSSYCQKISKRDGFIDWNNSSENIYNKIRAFTPIVNVYTFLEEERFIITSATFERESKRDVENGTIVSVDERGIRVCCGSGSLIITKLKVPGKREMLVKDYLKGNEIREGMVFGR